MDYELAKQLKDAGFPFRTNMDGPKIYADIGIQPTLSELIEACGDEFGSLSKGDNGIWYVHQWAMKEEVTAFSPEQAVAKLWLALNKK